MDLNREKLRALVLYIIWKAGEQKDFGITKLYKTLWFSEARAYQALGRPITGETYVRQKFGPVPKHVGDVLNELERDGQIMIWSEPYFDFKVIRFRAFEPAGTDLFTPDELSLIDWWVKHIDEEHSAASISEKSHDYGWKIAGMGEELPLRAFLASRVRAPNDEELSWAQEEASRLGLK